MAESSISKSSPAEPELSNAPEWLDEVIKKTLMKKVESPRAYVIIIVAYIDDLITRNIKAGLLVPRDGDEDLLFGERGPLYNLGAKLRLAHRMGIISSEMNWTLDKLRKLRDTCAHIHTEFAYDEGAARDIIDEIHNRLTDTHRADSSAAKFEQITHGVLICLWQRLTTTRQMSEPAQKEAMFK